MSFVPLGGGGRIVDARPLDAMLVRGVARNLELFADGAGQVRVAMSPVSLRPSGDVTTSRLQHILTLPFPLTLGSDGLPFPLRTQVAIASSSGGATVAARVALSAPETARSEVAGSALGANAFSESTSLTTAAWSTPQMLTLTAGQTAQCARLVAVDDDTSVGVILAALSVWSTSEVAAVAILRGLYAQEYYGG